MNYQGKSNYSFGIGALLKVEKSISGLERSLHPLICCEQILEVPPRVLLSLNRLEQCLEISFPETLASLSLDHFEEQRRPIFDRLGEYLQEVAFVVAVDEDAEVFQLIDRLIDFSDATLELVVVDRRHTEEIDALVCEF